MDHLGHRDKVRDDRYEKMLELEQLQHAGADEEPMGGLTSHHLSRRKGRLGFGKRHYGTDCKWAGYHRMRSINDPGGDTMFDDPNLKGSWLGPSKKAFGI